MNQPKALGDLVEEFTVEFPNLYRKRSREENARMEAERRREERARHEREEGRQRLQWARWGIPSKDIPAIADGTLCPTPALAAVEAFENERATVLVLSGPVGCGKTTAAAQWLVQATGRGRGTYIESGPPLFLAIAQYARLNRFDDTAVTRVECADALVLDDLGAEYLDDKGAFTSLLDGLVDARYRHVLPTVITTNLRAEEFKARYSARTIDRLRERGEFVELTGASLRAGTGRR